MSTIRSPNLIREKGKDGVPALDVHELRVSLTGQTIDVVDGVSFTLAPGSILGIVGESGSGKTTLALALLGYARSGLSLASGVVLVNGLDMLSLSRNELREVRGKVISYVPQDPSASLNPSLRIGIQLTEVLTTHGFGSSRGDQDERLREMLAEVDLPDDRHFLSRYPHQLSGGQQQRIAIAMAFACRPSVVVLDEPTTGLDVTTQAHILATVSNLAHSHQTAVVYVSHDLTVVAGLSDRILVMYAGQAVEMGRAADILHSAAHPYTRRLVEAAPDPKRRRALAGIPGRMLGLGQRRQGCVFAGRCEFVEDACRVGRIAEESVSSDASHTARCRRWQIARSQARSTVNGDISHRLAASSPLPGLLQVEGLSAWFGNNRVLSDATFSISEGSCLALVGESGSGKTTLAKCISGMHSAASGEILLSGQALAQDARRRSAQVRRAIQYIFQSPYGSLNPRRTVRALLGQPLKQFELPRGSEAIADLLEQVALPPGYARRYPAQLSGGERQRVAIARALAVSPQLLICDEITSALDVSVQASILALLARLHAESSLTVLFVTHNIAVVRAIADYVVVLSQGVIVEEGVTDTVLDDPKHPYTQRLVRDTPDLS